MDTSQPERPVFSLDKELNHIPEAEVEHMKAVYGNLLWIHGTMTKFGKAARTFAAALDKIDEMPSPAVFDLERDGVVKMIADLVSGVRTLAHSVDAQLTAELSKSIQLHRKRIVELVAPYTAASKKLTDGVEVMRKCKAQAQSAITALNAFKEQNPTISEDDKKLAKSLASLEKGARLGESAFTAELTKVSGTKEQKNASSLELLAKAETLDWDMATEFRGLSVGFADSLTAFSDQFGETASNLSKLLHAINLERCMQDFVENAKAHASDYSGSTADIEKFMEGLELPAEGPQQGTGGDYSPGAAAVSGDGSGSGSGPSERKKVGFPKLGKGAKGAKGADPKDTGADRVTPELRADKKTAADEPRAETPLQQPPNADASEPGSAHTPESPNPPVQPPQHDGNSDGENEGKSAEKDRPGPPVTDVSRNMDEGKGEDESGTGSGSPSPRAGAHSPRASE